MVWHIYEAYIVQDNLNGACEIYVYTHSYIHLVNLIFAPLKVFAGAAIREMYVKVIILQGKHF